MAERRIDWRQDEPTGKIQGGLTFIKAHLNDVPEVGWWRSPFPFKASTKAAYQAVRKLELAYGHRFEFRVEKSDLFDSVYVRRKQ